MMTPSKPKNVWVFYGGISSEREVSIRTSKGVMEALKSRGFNATSFDVTPGEAMLNIVKNNAKPDIVFLALHGTFGEDGRMQGFLDALKIPYVGSGVFSSALCFHKGLTKRMLQMQGLPCPSSIEFFAHQNVVDVISKQMPFETFLKGNWFIKAAREGSTVGINRYRGEGRAAFDEKLKDSLKYDSYILIEEWCEGPELTVPVMEGKAYPVVEIRPLSQFYDYESKYTAGKTEYLCPAPLSAEDLKKVQSIAEGCFRVLENVDYGRVDMILTSQGPKVLEMNTLPGLTETSLVPKSMKAAGLSYADFLDKLITSSYQRQMNLQIGKQ